MIQKKEIKIGIIDKVSKEVSETYGIYDINGIEQLQSILSELKNKKIRIIIEYYDEHGKEKDKEAITKSIRKKETT